MSVKKGKKIIARFYTSTLWSSGAVDREKYSWICSCGREFDSRTVAQKCEKSGHRNRDPSSLENLEELPVEILTTDEKDVLRRRNMNKLINI
jgi:hypothetical protein